MYIWGCPKIRGTLFEGPHTKDYSILGSILGSPVLGDYHIGPRHGAGPHAMALLKLRN